ncbi:MAG TPA: NAD(P)/FAD-dependent oxidoreductase [Verrucomicrobiae bacterium]|nr:NAD(P)/FAD-dependent oxidoreductase [Verrucomicrobiae bacterium]
MAHKYDAVVVGSGPNGLSAGIRLAQTRLSVLLIEGSDAIGGGARSAELTLPGFLHDTCSAIHPLGLGSPFFKTLPLAKHGLKWIQPDFPLAHPFDDGTALLLERGFQAASSDWRELFEPLAQNWQALAADFLAPMLRVPKHPIRMARFGLRALRSAETLVRGWNERDQALFAGLAGHSFLRLDERPSAAFGIVLGLMAHAVGWAMPRGGSQQISNALAAYFKSLGGEIQTGTWIKSIDQLPPARAYLLDVTPRQLIEIADAKMPSSYRRKLNRYRYGPGVFKVDYALSVPIPWRARECAAAGTVHLGGTFSEIARAERQVWKGQLPEQPFVLLAQPTLFDPTRAPAGRHIAWAYCHVPNGSIADASHLIDAQIERFAPGFRDCILARSTRNCADLERTNPNYVGGDINGGAATLRQLIARPTLSFNPYATPIPGVFLCSSSTPPGGGVHGMCGFHAANAALRHLGHG